MDLPELKKRGCEFYKKSDFGQALLCFDAIISRTTKPPLSILDCRAGTYIKLGELERALKDGKKMIKEWEERGVGYLRTGQILHLMGKNDKALSIYERGLKKVKSSDDDIKKLQAMYRKLKAVDPFEVLPFELLEAVLNYLSFVQKIILLRVSKKWNQVLESMPSLWRHLDLSKAGAKFNTHYFRKHMQRTRRGLTHATLPHCYVHDLLSEVVSNSPQLEYLKFSGQFPVDRDPGRGRGVNLKHVPWLKTLIWVPPTMRVGDITGTFKALPLLEHAEFFNIIPNWEEVQWAGEFSALRVLKLHALDKEAHASLELSLDRLFAKVPSLHELSLHMAAVHKLLMPDDLSILTELRILSVKNTTFGVFPCLPQTLESLEIDCVKIHSHLSDLDRNRELMERNNFSGLKSFAFKPKVWWYQITELFNAVLATGQIRLKRLALDGYKDLEDSAYPLPTLTGIISSGCLADVTEIALPDCDIDDRLADIIATNCPNLQFFDARRNPKLSGVGVKALILRKGTNERTDLMHINLDECTGVGKDAVDWARLIGLKVDFRFKEMKGKKVRTG